MKVLPLGGFLVAWFLTFFGLGLMVGLVGLGLSLLESGTSAGLETDTGLGVGLGATGLDVDFRGALGVSLTFSSFILSIGLTFFAIVLLCCLACSTINVFNLLWKYFSDKGRAVFLTLASSNFKVWKRLRA